MLRCNLCGVSHEFTLLAPFKKCWTCGEGVLVEEPKPSKNVVRLAPAPTGWGGKGYTFHCWICGRDWEGGKPNRYRYDNLMVCGECSERMHEKVLKEIVEERFSGGCQCPVCRAGYNTR